MNILHYRTYGNPLAPPLVLVHGVGGSMTIFYKQIQYYKEHFFVIALDLPGHGRSYELEKDESITFRKAAKSVLGVLDALNIKSAFFVGVSLGTVIIHELLAFAPERVRKVVLGGAITRINLPSKLALKMGSYVKSVIPYMWLYKLSATVIMPKKNHVQSRNLFIKEAGRMGNGQFYKWYDLAHVVDGIFERAIPSCVKKLYVTGKQDHFLYKLVKQDVQTDPNATFIEFENCGHVCNLDQAKRFNEVSVAYLLDESNENSNQSAVV